MQGLNNLSIYCLACLLPHHRFALCLKYVCAQNLQLIFGEGVIISVKSHSTGRELGKRKGTGKTQHFVHAEETLEKHSIFDHTRESIFNHTRERELEKHGIFNYTRERELEKHSIFNHAQEREQQQQQPKPTTRRRRIRIIKTTTTTTTTTTTRTRTRTRTSRCALSSTFMVLSLGVLFQTSGDM